MVTFLPTIPNNLMNALVSPEYGDFSVFLNDKYDLSDQQLALLDDQITYLCNKQIEVSQLVRILESTLKVSSEIAREIALDVIGNIVLPFPEYFNDQFDYYLAIGGTEERAGESFLLQARLRVLNEELEAVSENIPELDLAIEAEKMKRVFSREIVGHLYTPGAHLELANRLVLELLTTFEGYDQQLLQDYIQIRN